MTAMTWVDQLCREMGLSALAFLVGWFGCRLAYRLHR